MKDAKMNYVNDSAPMHIASAVNAPVTAVFCSTVPEFGFGPLSDVSIIVRKRKSYTADLVVCMGLINVLKNISNVLWILKPNNYLNVKC